MNNNPLRQYFRRPALFINLPSKGKYYPEGAVEITETQELPVYPMTAIDEITARTPDALFNGSAVAELIKSCIPAIKDPWVVPSTDLDALLIAIRAATNGNELDIESICGKCNESSKYGINLIGLLNNISAKGYDETINLDELTFKFKPLTYKEVNKGNMDQFEVQNEINRVNNLDDAEEKNKQSLDIMKKLNKLNINLITCALEYIKTPTETVTNKDFITEFLESCDKNTFETIRNRVIKLREETSTKPIKIQCVNCSHEYDQPLALNATDFFE